MTMEDDRSDREVERDQDVRHDREDQYQRETEATRPTDEPAGEPAGERAGERADEYDARRQAGADTAVDTAPDVEPTSAAGAGTPGPGAERSDLLGDGELSTLRDRWAGLQAMFVDDPAQATRQADTMVGDLLDHLRGRHQELHDGGRGANGQTDTEALRVEFLRYRSFLKVLLG